jgi:ABC-type nitrate/sulfonate/bicarbonate transport system substrate-binding protein
MTSPRLHAILLALFLAFVMGPTQGVEGKSYLAYISDSPTSTAAYWVAKDGGIFAKYGLDLELIFISGSTRGIQSLIAGDVSFMGH